MQYPVLLSQVGSSQFGGHCDSQAGPQYPCTHPLVQLPEASQTLFLQVFSHPKIDKIMQACV